MDWVGECTCSEKDLRLLPRQCLVGGKAALMKRRTTCGGNPISVQSIISFYFSFLFVFLYTGCLKKGEFCHIEHSQIGFPPFYRQHLSKIVFLAYFNYNFWAENGPHRCTNLCPKFITKNGCCGAIFSHDIRHDLGALDPAWS